MNQANTNIYVGCSLTQATEKFRDEVEDFKTVLKQAGHTVFDFIGLENGTDEDVYNWDIGHCVKDCDILVGVCDNPSIGLGWELADATRLGKKVLAIAHEKSQVTRLVLGAAAVEPNVHFMRYATLGDVLSIVDEVADGVWPPTEN